MITQEQMNELKAIREMQLAKREEVKKKVEKQTADLKAIREKQLARRAALKGL